jgi:hypothetical protein
MNYTTTRTYARRTWERDPVERAQWFEGPTRQNVDRPVMIAAAVCFVSLCVLVIFGVVK